MKYRVYYTKKGSTRKHYNHYEPVRRDLAVQFIEMMNRHADPGVVWDFEPLTVDSTIPATVEGK